MKRILRTISLITVCLLSICLVSCLSTRKKTLPVFITEICYGNDVQDTEPEHIPAFVEFRNSTAQDMPLDGFFISYFISSDKETLYKFPLSGYSVPANGDLIIDFDPNVLPGELPSSGVELFL